MREGNPIEKSDTAIQRNPLNFIRSGRYLDSSGGINDRSSYGLFWESTPSSATYASGLRFSSTALYPQGSYDKGYGFTLRCLVR